MKNSKVSQMNMKTIMDKVNIILGGVNQIFYFYEDEDRAERRKKVDELRRKMNEDTHAIYEFLIENTDKIDKEKFLLIVTQNHIENLKYLDHKIKETKIKLENKLSINTEEKMKLQESLDKYVKDKKEKEENLKKLRKLGNDLDMVAIYYFFDEDTKRYDIDIFDSEMIMKGRRRNSSKQIENLNKTDEQLKQINKEKNLGIEYIIQSLLLTDFGQIFDSGTFGSNVREKIIDNALLDEKIKTRDEIETIRNTPEYNQAAKMINFDKIIPSIREDIEKYIDYLDFNKLLLISGCKIEDLLETGLVDKKYFKGEKAVLKCILDNLEDNKEYILDLEFNSNLNNNYTRKEVKYSKKDIKNCLKRFTENYYVTKEEISKTKNMVQEGNLNLTDIEYEKIGVIFSDEDLNEMNSLSDEDLAYLSEKLNWDKQTILEKLKNNKRGCSKSILEYFIELQKIEYEDLKKLYLNQTIDIENFREICENVDVSKLINSYELIEYYNYSIQKEASEQDKEQYNRYVDLCKEYILKDEEKSSQFSENLMENLIENYDKTNKKVYINQIEEFFKQELIQLDTLIEWNDEDITNIFIKDMYSQGKISFEEIKELIKANVLSFEYLEKLVYTEGMEDQKIMEILEQGFIDEENIFELFAKGKISKENLISLANKDIIDSEEVNEILGINKDELTTDDQYILLISGALQKIRTTGEKNIKEQVQGIIKKL